MDIHLFPPFLQGYAVSLVIFRASVKNPQIMEVPYSTNDFI